MRRRTMRRQTVKQRRAWYCIGTVKKMAPQGELRSHQYLPAFEETDSAGQTQEDYAR